MTRSELYQEIKRLGLQEECKKKFHDNYTRVPSTYLEKLVKSHQKKDSQPKVQPKVEEKEPEKPTTQVKNTTNSNTTCVDEGARRAIKALATVLGVKDIEKNF